MAGVFLSRENLVTGEACVERMPHVETQGESGHLQATERGLEQIPKPDSLADTLISDF